MSTATGFTVFGPHIRGRACGACKACCTVVPVQLPTGNKPADTRCPHLCSRGCSIYAHRPMPCQVWSCRWLMDEDAAGLKRPDLSGYIVDPMPDTILWNEEPVEVIQVWIDPKKPEAHRDPALCRYLELVAVKYAMPAIIRFGSVKALAVFAPHLNRDGQWHEQMSDMRPEGSIQAKLAARRLAVLGRGSDGALAGDGGLPGGAGSG